MSSGDSTSLILGFADGDGMAKDGVNRMRDEEGTMYKVASVQDEII